MVAVPVLIVAIVVVLASLTVGRPALDRLVSGSRSDDTKIGEPIATADLTGSGPGSLVSATTMDGYSRTNYGRAVRSARVVYRSTSGDDGSPTVVSGTVFTPLGEPPAGGWPIVSFGHGTLGWQEPCGPSLSATLLGQAPAIDGFTQRGYAVVMADYQGLGSPGVHPYSDAKTAGLNMIDAVRALRHTFDGVSDRWAALGGSQGGGAAWAANEQAAIYAPELKLVGAVGLSPAADVTGLVNKAVAGTLTEDQAPVMQAILYSLARLHPDLDLDLYRHGAAIRYWDVLASCGGPEVHARTAAAKKLGPHDFSPSTPRGGRSPSQSDRSMGTAPTQAVCAVVRRVRRQGHLHRSGLDHRRDQAGLRTRWKRVLARGSGRRPRGRGLGGRASLARRPVRREARGQ